MKPPSEAAGGRWNAASNASKPAITFTPTTVADLIHDYPELRPSVISGLLREGEVMNLVSGPKMRKSWLVHSLAVSVATGQPWLGLRTSAGKVLLVDAELHDETLAMRLSATLRALSVNATEVSDTLTIWRVRGQCLTIDQIDGILAAVPRGEYVMVIIDALYRFWPEDAEENSNDAMTRVYNAVDALADRLGAAIVLVHHSTKGAQTGKSVTDIGSGGGAQSRAADTHLVLRPHEVDDAAIVEAAVRSWPPLAAFVILWKDMRWELAPDLDPTAARQVRKGKRAAGDQPASKPTGRTWSPKDFAVEIVGAVPKIREEILAAAKEKGLSGTQAESLLKRAVDQEVVIRHVPSGNRTHRFSSGPPTSQLPLGPGGDGGPLTPELHARGGGGGPVPPPP